MNLKSEAKRIAQIEDTSELYRELGEHEAISGILISEIKARKANIDGKYS